jgi:hypothetical protein
VIATGYLHPQYAASLSAFGQPQLLPRSGGWILRRRIPGSQHRDGMGCYPLFACRDWSRLHQDLTAIQGELVSLAVVTDPFGDYDSERLQQCFPERVVPFKEHFVIDLRLDPSVFVSTHHQRYSRKALQTLQVERCEQPRLHLEEWNALYAILVERHGIRGIPAFSHAAFAKQLGVPGLTAFRAHQDGMTLGMTLWFAQGSIAYYHLGAYSDAGYKQRASFALFWHAIHHFAHQGLRWLNLGAGAGVKAHSSDGLTRFKRGWASGSRTAYFCGRIFDEATYQSITSEQGWEHASYFPAYRQGEFA